MLNCRLLNWAERNNKISDFQAGFRKGYSTVEQIFILTTMVQIQLDKNTKMYAFFVDFKTAFDHVQRHLLFYKLAQKGVSTKFLNAIKALYNTTTAIVWNGEEISDEFHTNFGIKQGCNLSPLLFTLFIDDLVEVLPGGVQIGESKIKLLKFADDIVMFAKTPDVLQLMLNRLESYCSNWGLTVNLDKSKAMIFKKGGGRHANNEKWWYKGQPVEVVNQYKYLGCIITPNLNMQKHLRAKVGEAKAGLAITWKKLIHNNYITTEAKFRIFQSTSMATALYADGAWGYIKSEEIENLQRTFLKRVFKLPITSPNYSLPLETGLPDLHLTTLKHHFEFITKIIMSEKNKLCKRVAQLAIRGNLAWFKSWALLAQQVNFNMAVNIDSPENWASQFDQLLNKLHIYNMNQYRDRAASSTSRLLYPRLVLRPMGNTYFTNKEKIEVISTIFRARIELLNLNYIPHRNDLSPNCTLCNIREPETIIHFLAVCPILQELRRLYFGKTQINEEEICDILNGENWKILFNYCKEASNYRNSIINEYI